MKKGLKLFATGFVAMSALALHVNAEEVTNEASLNTCIAKNSNVCKLTENIELENLIDVRYDITLDLNGYSITPKETLKHSGGLVTVIHGGKLTIEDSGETGKISTGDSGNVWGAVQLTKKDDNDISKKATLVVNDGTLEGYYYAVTGNGNPDRINTDITINGGKLVGLKEDESLGIYHPQDGVLTVNGGEITGDTGIEMRAGKLTVTGGTIRGSYKPTEFVSNGSGSTTIGAGIAIAQHTTKLPINVKVSGGTIEGYTALHEVTTETEVITKDDVEKIKIEVTGGTFNAINEGQKAVYSQNKTAFITGGEFNTSVDSTYLVASTEESDAKTDVYEVVTPEGETKYVVADEDEVVETSFEAETTTSEEMEKEIAELEKMLGEVNKDELTEEELEEFEEIESFLEQIKEALDGKNIASAHDIYYGSFIGENYVENSNKTKLDKAVEVTLAVPESLEKVKEGYTRKYSVIRLHWDADTEKYEVKALPATEKDGKVTFETDKFSTYVLAYEDVKDTKNPNTGDNMLVYFATAVMSVIGLALTTLRITKKQK